MLNDDEVYCLGLWIWDLACRLYDSSVWGRKVVAAVSYKPLTLKNVPGLETPKHKA